MKRKSNMRRVGGVLATSLLLAALSVPAAHAQNEAQMHPRIVQAIRNLEEAIAYMEAAPHNFGGHKAAAVNASRAAIQELRAALAFRFQQDRRF